MPTIVNTTKIPCRAKDPHTCKYHGAELNAEAALKIGNIDGFLHWQSQMSAAAKTTAEVVEFFIAQQQNQPDSSREENLRIAQRSLANRISSYYVGDPNERFPLGGSWHQTAEQVDTVGRQIYAATAQRLLGLATQETRDGVTEYGIDRERLIRALDIAQNDNLADVQEDGELAGLGIEAEVNNAHNYGRKVLLEQFNQTGTTVPAPRVSLYRLMNAMDRAYWQKPNPAAKDGQRTAPTAANPPVQRQHGFQQADRTRDARIKDHIDNGEPYLVGGRAQDVEDTEFTPARLVYQRAANLLLKNAKYRHADGFDGYVVSVNDFERDYRGLQDQTATELGLNELATESEIRETHQTVEQVYRTLGGHFQQAPYGERTAVLNRSLRSLDLAFWNSPNGPGAR